MNIVNNIDVQLENIRNGDETLAKEISDAALDAVLAGIGKFDQNGVVIQVTPQWEKFMRYFAGNEQELARLCGKEKAFNDSEWGLHCLAYMAGDSDCTSETQSTTGAKRTMTLMEELAPSRRMLETLDAEGVDLANLRSSNSEGDGTK
ncbi:MAG: hypothetical protein WA584_20475 [Pyrinomonadaceae bacterium]